MNSFDSASKNSSHLPLIQLQSDLAFLLDKVHTNRISYKAKDLEFLEKSLYYLKGSNISNQSIKNLCTYSIPELCKRIRPFCWRLLLGFNYTDLEKQQIENIKNYEENILNYFKPIKSYGEKRDLHLEKGISNMTLEEKITKKNFCDHPLSKSKQSSWNCFFEDQKLWDEIEKDVKRTRKDVVFFAQGNLRAATNKYPNLRKSLVGNMENHYDVLIRLLFIYAKVNPAIGYVQGMNELIAPIYFCFANEDRTIMADNCEADTYFCFEKLMDDFKNNFIKINGEDLGVQLIVKNFTELLKKLDTKMYENLRKNNVSPELFCTRWILLLFSQEFAMEETQKIWDAILSAEKKVNFVEFLCLGVLNVLREELMKSEFSEIIFMLQNIRSMDVKSIIEKARNLYNEYGK